jgi:sec-independent protein translocase protein TatA
MGISGISIWELLVILLIILVLFGTKKLRSIGTDLGEAVKSFRNALRDEESSSTGEAQIIEHKQEQTNMESYPHQKQNDSSFKVKSDNEIK